MTITTILFLLTMAIGTLHLILFDLLVRKQFYDHREAWEKEGKIPGFFFNPEGSRFFSGSIAKIKISNSWLFHDPAWAADEVKARAYLLWYRVTYILGILLLFVLVYFIFYR